MRLLQTLELFRKEKIHKARDDKKKFDKGTERYYDALQKHLGTNPKKKADNFMFEVQFKDDYIKGKNNNNKKMSPSLLCRLIRLLRESVLSTDRLPLSMFANYKTSTHRNSMKSLSL